MALTFFPNPALNEIREEATTTRMGSAFNLSKYRFIFVSSADSAEFDKVLPRLIYQADSLRNGYFESGWAGQEGKEGKAGNVKSTVVVVVIIVVVSGDELLPSYAAVVALGELKWWAKRRTKGWKTIQIKMGWTTNNKALEFTLFSLGWCFELGMSTLP